MMGVMMVGGGVVGVRCSEWSCGCGGAGAVGDDGGLGALWQYGGDGDAADLIAGAGVVVMVMMVMGWSGAAVLMGGRVNGDDGVSRCGGRWCAMTMEAVVVVAATVVMVEGAGLWGLAVRER
ncbi:hypothetical protein F0562_007070 [Nyssa sinensis]|uniref:Uncharacterized protein n=1 Tax=Nyssa sinensis TaxID=561372 RepID=A0A5J5A4W2_9ASTE|nr:hypothetical protein F0562_007070 [Nyssa sinensis]